MYRDVLRRSWDLPLTEYGVRHEEQGDEALHHNPNRKGTIMIVPLSVADFPHTRALTNAKKTMTATEQRAYEQLEKEMLRKWRNFYIHLLKNRGYTNVAIAKHFGISESTVRNNLKFQVVR